MARYFLDTSALIKNYHVEAGTSEVQRILTEPDAELLISRPASDETLSGFAHFVRSDQRLCDIALLEGLAVIQP